MKCDYSIFLDSEMLGFVNPLLTLPRHSEHFGSFPQNSLNGGVRYNKQIFPVPWHFVKSRFQLHCLQKLLKRGTEKGILGFGIRNSTQGIRNPAYDWNLESKFYGQEICNPIPGIWNLESSL